MFFFSGIRFVLLFQEGKWRGFLCLCCFPEWFPRQRKTVVAVILSSGASLIGRRRESKKTRRKKKKKGKEMKKHLTRMLNEWRRKRIRGNKEKTRKEIEDGGEFQKTGIGFEIEWLRFQCGSRYFIACASSWVERKNKQSVKINKEGNQKRRWWNDETRGLAHSNGRWVMCFYTHTHRERRVAKSAGAK